VEKGAGPNPGGPKAGVATGSGISPGRRSGTPLLGPNATSPSLSPRRWSRRVLSGSTVASETRSKAGADAEQEAGTHHREGSRTMISG
jgi:hypothetical protein